MIATGDFYAVVYEGETMRTSDKGKAIIKEAEGYRGTAYRDPVGVLTIGWGHTGKDVTDGMTITQEQAEELLEADLKRFESAVEKSGLDLTQNEFDALVSFTYNLGEANLRRLIKGRTLHEIAAKIPSYNKAGGKVLPGLTKRRKAEQALFKTGMKTDYDIALEVLAGMWGAGMTRKRRLTSAGHSYGNVQKEINRIIADDGK